MKKFSAALLSTVLAVLLISGNSYAASGQDYWPNWRGPDNTGVSKTANPPVKWSETENVKWKVAMPGDGLSTPIVWENKIIFLIAIESDAASTAAANGGTILTPAANSRRGGRGNRTGGGLGGGSASTKKYKFDIVCLNRENGQTLWEKTAIETVPHEGHHKPEVMLQVPLLPMENIYGQVLALAAFIAMIWTVIEFGERIWAK